MNKQRTITSVLILIVGASCLFGAGGMHPGILDQRRELNQAEPVENLPPAVAFITVALGGFRGIMADILWVRAQRLQNQGKYLELVQLGDMITKLQPRMAATWAYQSWNMAYNVSVMYPEWPDRWRWVNHGIRLLRTEGLKYNPGAPKLYSELAWIYHHKIGAQMDQAHFYYKQQFGAEMDLLFGGARPDYARFAELDIPVEAFRKRPGVAALLGKISATGIKPLEPLLAHNFLSGDGMDRAVLDMIATDPAGKDFIDFIRVRLLREEYRLDYHYMQSLEKKYGPLDWRIPQFHSVYWANQGMPFAKDFERITLQRLIFQPMAGVFNMGTIVIDPVTQTPVITSNPKYLSHGLKAFDYALSEHPDDPTFHTAYINFLKRAAVELYSHQQEEKAAEMLSILRVSYADRYGEQDNEKMIFDFLVRAQNPIPVHVLDEAMGEFIQMARFWDRANDPKRAEGYRNLIQLIRGQAKANDIDLPSDDEILTRLRSFYEDAFKNAPKMPMVPPNHNQGHGDGHGHKH